MYKQIEADSSHKANGMRKRLRFIAIEEKESCGSNDVSLHIDVGSVAAPKDVPRPTKNRNKTARSISKQDATSSYLRLRESKDSKKVCQPEDGKDKVKMSKQTRNKREMKKHRFYISSTTRD
ncbi:Hypothetical predicted protein [Olea europaea subsp. europaea]|uniref:Uncharacterized protein n=1 Tax=Olea europaea subsp. europaea TaxID=158383 RepID=A0A8S0TXZ3_OLEEU|nr:Hypothetical predicted protein [Olea europaea subsp. europaea]